MRISDWSSVLCSSDLSANQIGVVPVRLDARFGEHCQDVAYLVYRGTDRGDKPAVRHHPAIAGPRQRSFGGMRQPAKPLEIQKARIALDRMEKPKDAVERSEEHTSELQSLMRISYAVFCLKKKTNHNIKD